jgi:threonine/homoserine/homoserine lactone efflux protein
LRRHVRRVEADEGLRPDLPTSAEREEIRALGAALSGANPKNLALTLAAAASIAEAGLDQADEAIAIVVFVALGSITVAGRCSSTSSTPSERRARSTRRSGSCPTTMRSS